MTLMSSSSFFQLYCFYPIITLELNTVFGNPILIFIDYLKRLISPNFFLNIFFYNNKLFFTYRQLTSYIFFLFLNLRLLNHRIFCSIVHFTELIIYSIKSIIPSVKSINQFFKLIICWIRTMSLYLTNLIKYDFKYIYIFIHQLNLFSITRKHDL